MRVQISLAAPITTVEQEPMKTTECLNCGKSTNNPKFCSRSCSCSYNKNREGTGKCTTVLSKNGKYTWKDTCPQCGELKTKDAVRCITCRKVEACSRFDERKIKDAISPKYANSLKYNMIREYGKKKVEMLGYDKTCTECGWGVHVEVCHIRPIMSFDPEQTVGEVNSLDNLTYLCPNCHWMFDNGILSEVKNLAASSNWTRTLALQAGDLRVRAPLPLPKIGEMRRTS